jgi:hypothetical protein
MTAINICTVLCEHEMKEVEEGLDQKEKGSR